MKPEVFLIDDTSALFDKLNDRQREIVEILNQVEEISFSDILKKLKNPPSEKTLKRDLGSLKKQGIIDVKGRAWTAVWFLKNR